MHGQTLVRQVKVRHFAFTDYLKTFSNALGIDRSYTFYILETPSSLGYWIIEHRDSQLRKSMQFHIFAALLLPGEKVQKEIEKSFSPLHSIHQPNAETDSIRNISSNGSWESFYMEYSQKMPDLLLQVRWILMLPYQLPFYIKITNFSLIRSRRLLKHGGYQ